MRPIELTRIFESGKTEPFYVNPDHIVSFADRWRYEPHPIGAGSYITLSAGGSYAIKETPEQIIGRLADHRSTMRAEDRDGIKVYR